MKTLGRHLIAEFYKCNADTLNDRELIEKLMSQAAVEMGATIVGVTFHHFSPQGVSGSVVIAESHLSIHTWPESGYVAVDIFTCGGLNPRHGFQLLGAGLEAQSARFQEIVRGLPEDTANLSELHPLMPSDIDIITKEAEEIPLTPPSVA
ncbi:MAG TPA: adenosylmethionine decarboxylase [Flavobacteriales bacterium]|nr:adenosylmethionine decarboxylase [Flavobacteriales bacterium]